MTAESIKIRSYSTYCTYQYLTDGRIVKKCHSVFNFLFIFIFKKRSRYHHRGLDDYPNLLQLIAIHHDGKSAPSELAGRPGNRRLCQSGDWQLRLFGIAKMVSLQNFSQNCSHGRRLLDFILALI